MYFHPRCNEKEKIRKISRVAEIGISKRNKYQEQKLKCFEKKKLCKLVIRFWS